MEFSSGDSGEVRTPDGISLGFTNYKSSDGVNLMLLYSDFADLAQASQAFDKEIARAAKIVERSAKLDSKGRVVGQRAEVLLQSNEKRRTLFAVMWTDGVKYHEIQSRSLRRILELERDYRY